MRSADVRHAAQEELLRQGRMQRWVVRVCGGNDESLWGTAIVDSLTRHKRVQHIINATLASDLEVVRGILEDKKCDELANQAAGEHRTTAPIQMEYDEADETGFCMGTVCSVIFDLEERTLHITRGHPNHHPWEAIEMSECGW